MSSLSSVDKLKLEKLLGMDSGYVLNFSNRTFHAFVLENTGKDIDDAKYAQSGTSKANRLRSFWQIEPDGAVGKLLHAMLDYVEALGLIDQNPNDQTQKNLATACKGIANRLLGQPSKPPTTLTEEDFIRKEFSDVSFDRLNLPVNVITVLNQRISEIGNCLGTKSWLSVVFLCGSALEGILLGVASNKASEYKSANTSPKDKSGAALPIHEWKLAQLIDTSLELRVLDENVKKFSHGLRDFRNYIHPYKQVSSGFDPNEHTAKICWQVLRAVIEQVSK